ncbi:sporulation histidine kinase inhibitor Sda [Bacillus sp. SA1-12]|nr:sporulation histidine kinase inhibitor Sda [Bacillus sp. SA1-12]
MRFSNLSNEILLESYQESCRLQISNDFIKMLEREIFMRGLPLPAKYVKQ